MTEEQILVLLEEAIGALGPLQYNCHSAVFAEEEISFTEPPATHDPDT